jgi:RNA polymerase sigma factor (sigma-70 family)
MQVNFIKKLASKIVKFATMKVADILTEDDLFEQIRAVQIKKDQKAFLALTKKYNGLINRIVDSFVRKNYNVVSKEDVQAVVISMFFDILLDIDLEKNKFGGQITNFINLAITRRANNDGIKHALGITPLFGARKKSMLMNAIKKFIMTYKRNPDFDNEYDLVELAKTMNTTVIDVKDAITTTNIDSLYAPIKSDNKHDLATSLIETIPSSYRTPEEFSSNKELKRKLEDELAKLTGLEKQVLLMYVENRDELTKDDIAEKLHINSYDVKNILNRAKEKLKRSPILNSYIRAHKRSRLVKLASEYLNFLK